MSMSILVPFPPLPWQGLQLMMGLFLFLAWQGLEFQSEMERQMERQMGRQTEIERE